MTNSNNDFVGVLEVDLNGQDLRIGIVQARFNEDHCVALTTACINEFRCFTSRYQTRYRSWRP